MRGWCKLRPGLVHWSGGPLRSRKRASRAAGFAALEDIPADRVATYQPYWAARGHLLHLLKRKDEARKRSFVPRA